MVAADLRRQKATLETGKTGSERKGQHVDPIGIVPKDAASPYLHDPRGPERRTGPVEQCQSATTSDGDGKDDHLNAEILKSRAENSGVMQGVRQ